MNAAGHQASGPNVRPRSKPTGALRLMKWVVLIVLLVLLLVALFFPDRGLAATGQAPRAERNRDQLSSMSLPVASSTPSENRMRTRSPSISKGTAMRASSW